MSRIGVAVRFARREIRGGLAGFRILVACLALGVAAIAAAGSLRAAVGEGLARDARALLGGDIEFEQSYLPLAGAVRAALAPLGTLSDGVEMRAMARREDGARRRLVELKGVDERYPLVGTLALAPAQGVDAALGARDGVWGAAADPELLADLGLTVGDSLTVGEARFRIRAVILREPDRVATMFALGPRLMIARAAVAATGLIQPGSVVRYVTRLVLAPGRTVAEVRALLDRRFPDGPWRLRDTSAATPGLTGFFDTMAVFLTLVGLTALLVGGIGVANAVKAHMDGRLAAIATLKAVGASGRMLMAIHGLVIAAMAALGILIGLVLGAAVPVLAVVVAGDRLPAAMADGLGLYFMPLAVAAGCGALTAATFALWPLSRACRIPAAALFRDTVAPARERPSVPVLAALAVAALGLAALAVLGSERRMLALGFVGAAVATLALFRGLAWVLAGAARRLSRRWRHGSFAHPAIRLALANLHRPGGTLVSMVLSLGLGLTVLVAVAEVEGNLARTFGEVLPTRAPSFFFIDIQPDQHDRFLDTVRGAAPGAEIDMAPMLRGRIARIDGAAVDEARAAPDARWALRSDRGLTVADQPPPGTRLVAGSWWPPGGSGPPQASVEAGIARGLGIRVGDSVTLNVLGRDVTVRVASLRQVDWASFSMNFTFILSPDALAGAPMTWIATVRLPPGRDEAVERAVTDALPNVSAIRVKEALDAVRGVIVDADLAVRLAALVTLAAGGLVLAGAAMAGHRRRVTEAVVLKVLGATRADLWRAWALEFGVVGGVAGLGAGGAGTLAAWAVLTRAMRAVDWTFLPGIALSILGLCVAASLLAGFAGTWVALRAKPAPLLRGE